MPDSKDLKRAETLHGLRSEGLAGNPHLVKNAGRSSSPPPAGEEEEEQTCGMFGFLRGTRDRADMVRFCFRSGNSVSLAYHGLGGWEHQPSIGLLLKFTGDVVTLVLIQGSNLDAPVNSGGMNLTDRGLQRHRVTWIREMDQDELSKAGEAEPTIDAIEVAAFDSQDKLRQWVRKKAPAFLDGALLPEP